VRETVVEMAAAGEPVPEPISLRRYSGKFQVRTTPEIHRRLVIEATEAQVSLNRLINSKLLG
jgi:predicted HicB family RNase H-like nuclease